VDDAPDRKRPAQRDYEVAVMMTAALRSTLAHMKLGRPVSEVFGTRTVTNRIAWAHSDWIGGHKYAR